MKTLVRIMLASSCILSLYALARAEPPATEDEEWQALSRPVVVQRAERVSASQASLGEAKAQAEQPRRETVSQLIDQADRYRDFHRKHPKSGKVREARRQEAVLLLQAGFRGDKEQAARRRQLVGEIRADHNFAPAVRLEVAGYADNLDVIAQNIAIPAELTAALEKTTRQLVAEFPDAPAGYESLLNLAKDSTPDRAKAIFGDLMEMPAPEAVKLEAADWLERYALVGRPLADLAKPALGSDLRLERARGGIIVIYAWSVGDNTSVELAKQIGSIQMPGLTLFGVNLDEPAAGQQAKEMAALLPGEQLVLGKGTDTALAKVLLLNETPLIYVTDRRGGIFTVSAQNNPSRAIIDASLR